MKTLVKNIKSELESSSWDYQHCGSGWNERNDKAVSFLESTRFSEKLIEETLSECYSDILKNARNEKVAHDEIAHFFAASISDRIAYKRIPRNFLKAWSINSDVSFVLN